MKSFINCLTALLVLISCIAAQEQSAQNFVDPKTPVDARQIFQRAADACRKIKNIEYREEQFHTDHVDEAPFISATVRQERTSVPDDLGFIPGKFIVEGVARAKEPVKFGFSYDGKAFRILDASEKTVKVIKSPTAYVVGSMTGLTGLTGMPQFTHEEPFKVFLDQGENFTYEGTRVINGVECDVVSVTRTVEHHAIGKQRLTSRWFFGRRDALPRGNESGNSRKLIEILKINDASISPDYFIPAAEGYGEKLVTGKEPKTRELLAPGTLAPEWTLLDPARQSHSLSDYRGKLVLIDFWGTWCVPCWKTMPGIQRLHEKFKARDVQVFGISVNDKELDPAAFMQRKGYTYNLLLGGDQVSEMYKAFTLPTLYLIGFDGEIIHAEYGYRENAEEEITKIIEGYLKARKK